MSHWYFFIAAAVLSMVMAVFVFLDSKFWDDERHGLFEFKHRAIGIVNTFMVCAVPIILLIFILFTRINIQEPLLDFIARVGLFLLVNIAMVFIFFVVISFCSSVKWYQQKKKAKK